MLADEDSAITDDAMVVERMTNQPVKLIEGNYRNIKITTPEDMERAVAECSVFGPCNSAAEERDGACPSETEAYSCHDR